MRKVALSLHIKDLKTKVFIGHLEQEKLRPTQINWEVEMRFKEIPSACKTDSLEDTLCYDSVVKEIVALSSERRYNLLESLVHVSVGRILDLGGSRLLDRLLVNVTKPIDISDPAYNSSCKMELFL